MILLSKYVCTKTCPRGDTPFLLPLIGKVQVSYFQLKISQSALVLENRTLNSKSYFKKYIRNRRIKTSLYTASQTGRY